MVNYMLLYSLAHDLGACGLWCVPCVHVSCVQMHGAILALLASIIGPFGGFLASAIKRAYAVKDFAGVIPGHGGITDRMDCQLQVCWKETSYHIVELTVDIGLADGAWRMHALSHRAAPPSPQHLHPYDRCV